MTHRLGIGVNPMAFSRAHSGNVVYPNRTPRAAASGLKWPYAPAAIATRTVPNPAARTRRHTGASQGPSWAFAPEHAHARR